MKFQLRETPYAKQTLLCSRKRQKNMKTTLSHQNDGQITLHREETVKLPETM